MTKRKRKRGRPLTYRASFYVGQHTTQFWISKGVRIALGLPKRVKVKIVDDSGEEDIQLQVTPAKEGNEESSLSVTSGGYMSGEHLWTTLSEMKEKSISLRYMMKESFGDSEPFTVYLVPDRS